MCGICFEATKRSEGVPRPIGYVDGVLRERLACRGPDHQSTITTRRANFDLLLHSSVLALRGDGITIQPHGPDDSPLLCWNGQAWKIRGTSLDKEESDTLAIYDLLRRAACRDASNIIQAIMSIEGPFAFVFYDLKAARVYFGRDCIGRRSLLYKYSNHGIMLCSVGDGTAGWKEVPADGIYVLELKVTDFVEHGCSNRLVEEARAADLQIQHYSYRDHEKYPTFDHEVPKDQYRLTVHSSAVSELAAVLSSAIRLRVRDIPGLYFDDSVSQARIAILFSGGLDCTTIARMIHDLIPRYCSIDLLNVAFQNPHSASSSTDTEAAYNACPDRKTAISSFLELQALCPDRVWRLVEINVPYEETLAHRQTVVELLAPHNTEMDLSIGLALYFASRGKGVVRGIDTEPYTTPARVLFSGLGADEVFAGYSRHLRAFEMQGFPGLSAEMELDVNRLGDRNLGRDDRIIAHWGREVRFPFLDESVIKWAMEKGVGGLCGFGMTPAEGVTAEEGADIEPGKLVLRLLALKLGMSQVAREKKKAIQFGARTAKMGGRTKGTAVIG